MDYSRYRFLKIETAEGILRLTLNRPEVKNAANQAMHEELSQVFTDIDRDPAVKVVVVTGAGTAFSAGGDLDWLLSMRGDPVATAASIANDRKIQNALLDLEKPVIARVVGPAVGLGCSLALFCDFVYATPEARFADPHVLVGLVAGDGGAVMWPQLIGYARARRYLLTGDPVTGREAADMGLITAAVPAEEIDGVVEAMARRLASGPTYALNWTKAAINAGLKVTANAIIDQAAAAENLTMLMQDHGIALDAMKTRARPVFSGR
jgi:enoyl-CoA hydratase